LGAAGGGRIDCSPEQAIFNSCASLEHDAGDGPGPRSFVSLAVA
jgi:hypothetical protein